MTKHSLTTKTLLALLTQPGRHRPQRQDRFRKPARFNSDGFALPAAMFLVLAIIVASLIMTTRSLGISTRSIATSDSMAAKDAAEFGHTKLISQLNQDDKAYLLVTNFINWNSVSQSDLSSCKIYASTPPSTTTDAIAGVSINTKKTKIEPVGDSTTQSYSLTNFTAPGFATGNAASNNPSICSNSTASAAKFENLLGGSAMLTVTGTVTRNGKVAATYKLNRSVHVKSPNQAIANPIALIGVGTDLKYLNGRICQASTPPASVTTSNPCAGLQTTIVACSDVEGCLFKHVPDSGRNKYCKNPPYNTYKAGRRYKKNIPCNTFQQLAGMPEFPALGYGTIPLTIPGQTSAGQPIYQDQRPKSYESALGSSQRTVSIELNCGNSITSCNVYRYAYTSSKAPTTLSTKDGSTNFQDFSNFPYKTSLSDTDFDKITDKAGLAKLGASGTATILNDGCHADTGSIQTATTINCVFGDFTDSTPNRASFSTKQADLKVWHTDIIPVNLWIIGNNYGSKNDQPALDLDNVTSLESFFGITQGGIYNADETSDGWRNLKIFGYNSSSNIYLADDIPDGNNDCKKQTAKLGKSGRVRKTRSLDTEGIIDGAFMWFPNANFQINNLNARTTPYFVLWACQITGPKSLSRASAIFTPLSQLGVNAGISGLFNINGGAIGRTSYRAYGSKGTTTEDN
ncbi:MAG: hypothetical protein NTY67_02865 [Cyanobacteria bacterium]|nr:hypothetical protein [Cyanobacteriota bacterium]